MFLHKITQNTRSLSCRMLGLFLAKFSASPNSLSLKSFRLFSLSFAAASPLSFSSKICLVFGCLIFPQLFIFSYWFDWMCFLYLFSLRGGVEERKWLILFLSSILLLLALLLFLRLTGFPRFFYILVPHLFVHFYFSHLILLSSLYMTLISPYPVMCVLILCVRVFIFHQMGSSLFT